MKLSDYVLASGVADLPVTHKWDARTSARFLGIDADDKPKLSKALGAVSQRAVYAFCIAGAEWVLARVSRHIDIADGLQRLEAGWASTIDPRYATFTQPAAAPPDTDLRVAGPRRLSMMILMDTHRRYAKGDANGVYMNALSMTLLAEYVAGKNPAFKKWLPEKLEQLAKPYPIEHKPIADEPPVARESGLSDTVLDAAATEAAQRAFRATLDPAQNSYLTPAATLEAAGLTNPYPGR